MFLSALLPAFVLILMATFAIPALIVARKAGVLERITNDSVWKAWRLIAIEPIVSSVVNAIVVISTVAVNRPLILSCALLSPLLFGRAIYRAGQHDPLGRLALRMLLLRVGIAMLALTLLFAISPSVRSAAMVSTILCSLVFLLTIGFLGYQFLTMRRALKVTHKSTDEAVHNWEDNESILIKQLKHDEAL